MMSSARTRFKAECKGTTTAFNFLIRSVLKNICNASSTDVSFWNPFSRTKARTHKQHRRLHKKRIELKRHDTVHLIGIRT
jgi:hypothetical protein